MDKGDFNTEQKALYNLVYRDVREIVRRSAVHLFDVPKSATVTKLAITDAYRGFDDVWALYDSREDNK
jgi:hypothetical protein